MSKDIYKSLGVDADKSSIRHIFKKTVNNDCPNAFVVISKDSWSPKTWKQTMHADGSGSKSLWHYLYYLESKRYNKNSDSSKLKYDIQDAFSMNAGDVAAAGFVDKLIITDIVDINQKQVDKKLILRNLAKGIVEVISIHKKYGFPLENKLKIRLLGGETADLVNQCRSYSLNMIFYSRMRKENIITGNVVPGDTIYGISSGGRAVWEKSENSGHMSNGSTMTGSVLLSRIFNKSYKEFINDPYFFKGNFRFDDKPEGLNMSIADAILSPTRQWAIIIKMVIDELKKNDNLDVLHAIVMNTGGGQTKIAHVGSGIRYVKYPPEPLPLFKLIQAESRENWKNMHRTYNCGVGLEFIGSGEYCILANAIDKIAKKTGIKSFCIGECEKAKGQENEVILKTEYGTFEY